MNHDPFFLEQYKQVWEQRRQHVSHIWAIPVVITGLLGIFASLLIKNKINLEVNYGIKLLSLFLVCFGFFGLFYRHNFFIKVLGLLLEDLQKKPIARNDLPQFGDDFKRLYKDDLKKNSLDQFGSLQTGTFWWFIVVLGISCFVITNWWHRFAIISSIFFRLFSQNGFMQAYLILTVPISLLSFYFMFKNKEGKNWLDWFSSLWLLGFTIFLLFLLFGEAETAVEERTADINGIILVSHKISEVVNINSKEHLFPAFDEDETFSGKEINLIHRKPTAEQADKLIYRVQYKYKKYTE